MPDPIVTDADPLEGEALIGEFAAEAGDALDAALAKATPRTPAAPAKVETKPATAATAATPAKAEPKPGDIPDLALEELETAAPAGETKPAEEAKPKDDEEKVPANLKDPTQIANWKALRQEVKQSKTQAETVAKERDEWKARAEAKADPEEVARLKQERDRLADQIAHFALEKSPAFQAQFDAPIASAEKTVFDSLKAAGASEEQLTKLKEADGVRSFDLAYWDRVAGQLKGKKETEAQGLKVELAIRDIRRLAADREEALKDPEKRKSFQSKTFEEWKKRQEDDESFLQGFVAEVQSKHDWAKKKEVPAAATPEEKAAIEAHNKKFEVYSGIFTQAVTSDDMTVRAKIGLAAVTAYRLTDQNKALKESLAAAEKELTEIRSAGRVTKAAVRPGTKGPGVTASPETPSLSNNIGSDRDNLDDLLDNALKSRK